MVDFGAKNIQKRRGSSDNEIMRTLDLHPPPDDRESDRNMSDSDAETSDSDGELVQQTVQEPQQTMAAQNSNVACGRGRGRGRGKCVRGSNRKRGREWVAAEMDSK